MTSSVCAPTRDAAPTAVSRLRRWLDRLALPLAPWTLIAPRWCAIRASALVNVQHALKADRYFDPKPLLETVKA